MAHRKIGRKAISVFHGSHAIYREFSGGVTLLPMDNAERVAVARALREILDLVDGPVNQPSFSKGFGSNEGYLQNEPNHADHKLYVDELRIVLLADQSDSTNKQPVG